MDTLDIAMINPIQTEEIKPELIDEIHHPYFKKKKNLMSLSIAFIIE